MSLRTLGVRIFFCALSISVFGVRVHGGEVLTLEAVQTAALELQPLVEGQRAKVDAFRERAAVAGQLPDPELGIGINDMPIDTADAWSLSRDSDTQIMVGFTQSFPGGDKRRLRALREQHASQAAEEEMHDLEQRIRRDAGLAFAEVFLRQHEVELVAEEMRQAGLQKKAADIRFRSGSAAQSELLAASVEEALLGDKLAESRQMLAHARIRLERWVGTMAGHPAGDRLPEFAPHKDLARILEGLSDHPAIRMEDRAREAAEAGANLALQGNRPDWRLEVAYGHRPEFSEMLSVRASIGLPIFPRQRQDREAAAARHDVSAAVSTRANRLREFEAEAALAHHDSTVFSERLRVLQADVLPNAHARVDAADAAYRTGQGPLAEVLAARRSRLDVQLRQLELEVSAFRDDIELQYFMYPGAQP